jgi:vancomycin resistance protein YoaR
MKKNSKKYFIPVILAGVFILLLNFLSTVYNPLIVACAEKRYNKNIIVAGNDIGGLTFDEANFKLRQQITDKLKNNSFTIQCGNDKYYFYYPEIDYTSNVYELLQKLKSEKPKQKTEYSLDVNYYLKNIDGVVDQIYQNNLKKAQNAEIVFNENKDYPFTILKEKSGSQVDKKHLKQEIINSVNNGFYNINTKTLILFPEIKQNDLKKQTFLRSRFSTGYVRSSSARKHNIELASKFISGTILESGQEFSFNKIVGLRSESRGFKQAKIISNGKFVDGVGGGVCQLSTTLYNAALTAGLEITEHHRHTLSVSYIEPSFDAMVNSYTSDFKFKNNTNGKIFIKITADGQRLSVSIYGEDNEYYYKRISVVKGEIPPPPPEIIKGETEEIIQKAKMGLNSEGYLEIYKNGVLISKKLIRTDKYIPVREIRKII